MFGPGGSFFVGSMEGGTNGQTDSLPAGCGIGAALDA